MKKYLLSTLAIAGLVCIISRRILIKRYSALGATLLVNQNETPERMKIKIMKIRGFQE